MLPNPKIASRAPARPPSSTIPQVSGGSWTHTSGSFFATASTCAMTHSEIGTALAPRLHVSTVSPRTCSGNWSTPVPMLCTHRTPR